MGDPVGGVADKVFGGLGACLLSS